jgi:formylglycine-generating enzyme required for sulfatase activity
VSATSEVVIDRTTGLTWQRRHPVTLVTRDAAASYCRSLGLAGGGWRLPSARELSGSVRGGASSFFPPESSQVFFWSTTRADDGVQATAVGSDGSSKDDFPAFEQSVRCVRSGAQ